MTISRERAHDLLVALDEQLAATGDRFELVVTGGFALIALGLVDRATKDIDVVALRTAEGLVEAKPLPEALAAAARWTRTQDPSEGFLEMLKEKLAGLGVVDADLRA